MHFDFTEDQAAITLAARDMLIECCQPADLRRMLDADLAHDETRWRTITEMGLIGMLAPEDSGGMGLDLIDFVGIAEAAGYVALPEPLVELAGITVPLLARLRAEGFADKGDLLGAALGGNVIALGHPANPLIADADGAIAMILGDDQNLHAVERADVRLTRQTSFDPLRRLFSAEWDPAPASRAGSGWGDTAARGAVLAAAQLLGVAQRAIDMAVAYAGDRQQFGRAIGANQAVKHLLADAQVKVEFARPVVQAAAAELSQGTPAAFARAAHAKIAAGEAADLATRNAVQVHGAMGMTWEVDLHFWVKRALALQRAWGTGGMHMQTILNRITTLPSGADLTFVSAMTANS